MYCGIQYELEATLTVVITLFVIVYAIMFTLGLAALTAKELVIRLIKIALIWSFAMNASWGVGLAFYFLIEGIQEIVTWVLAVFFGDMGGHDFIEQIDILIYDQLTGGLTTDGYKLLGFFATLFALMFPVFMLFMVYMMTVMAVLMRTVITYLLGLSAIAFLLSLGPIFVSMALFKSTYTFFDSWFRYIVSFAMQIILVFAVVALWLYILGLTGTFFLDLADMVVPYEDKTESQASFGFFKNTWGICYNEAYQMVENGPWFCNGGNASPYCQAVGDPRCTIDDIAPPSAYSSNDKFISWIAEKLITLGILVYAFDAMLRMMPNLARQLSGPAFAPQLGGGTGFGSVRMPGMTMVDQAKNRMRYMAYSSGFSGLDVLRKNMGGLFTSKDSSRVQEYKDKVSRLAGGKRGGP